MNVWSRNDAAGVGPRAQHGESAAATRGAKNIAEPRSVAAADGEDQPLNLTDRLNSTAAGSIDMSGAAQLRPARSVSVWTSAVIVWILSVD